MKPLVYNGFYHAKTGAHLKAKNIKNSNGSLLFAAVHNIINSGYKPPKQIRVDFFSKGIPTKKDILNCQPIDPQ